MEISAPSIARTTSLTAIFPLCNEDVIHQSALNISSHTIHFAPWPSNLDCPKAWNDIGHNDLPVRQTLQIQAQANLASAFDGGDSPRRVLLSSPGFIPSVRLAQKNTLGHNIVSKEGGWGGQERGRHVGGNKEHIYHAVAVTVSCRWALLQHDALLA